MLMPVCRVEEWAPYLFMQSTATSLLRLLAGIAIIKPSRTMNYNAGMYRRKLSSIVSVIVEMLCIVNLQVCWSYASPTISRN